MSAAVCPTCQGVLPSRLPEGLCPRCLLEQSLRSESPDPARGGFTVPSLAELTPLLPGLELIELIGRGGMGAVYKARDRRIDRLVAVKVLPAELSAQPEFERRFEREVRALARLTHPFIVRLYDFGEAGPYYYLVQELVDGKNLRQALQAGVQPDEALGWMARVCEALELAHARGVIHRDLKPENILIDEQGCPRLADFGLAKLAGTAEPGPSLTRSRQFLGSPHYMPPEQMGGAAEVDHRADIFAVGSVLYELLTGTLPLGRFPLPSATAGVPRALDPIVLRCLERDPPARYDSAAELRRDLEITREQHYPRARARTETATRVKIVLGRLRDRFHVASSTPDAARLLARVAIVATLGVLLGIALCWSGWHFAWNTSLDLGGLGLGLPIPNLFLLVGLASAAAAAAVGRRHGLSEGSHRVLRWSATYASAHWLIAPPGHARGASARLLRRRLRWFVFPLGLAPSGPASNAGSDVRGHDGQDVGRRRKRSRRSPAARASRNEWTYGKDDPVEPRVARGARSRP